MSPGADHWQTFAAQWRRLGPPMRPVARDVGVMEAYVARWNRRRAAAPPPRALLLGVTPEITRMRWPSGTAVYAVDRVYGMFRAVWEADAPCAAGAVTAAWQRLPFAPQTFDLVLGDGFLNLFDFPEGQRRLAGSLRAVLRPGGRLIVRSFVRPAQPETAETVFADLAAGRIGSFHVFKWRLVMALQQDAARGVALARVWARWQEEGLDREALAARLGWPREEIDTIDAYRDAGACYAFPSLEELRAALAAHFTEEQCEVPDYELGERCPVLLLA